MSTRSFARRPAGRGVVARTQRWRRGMTLAEVVVALTIVGLLMVVVTTQLIESVSLSLHTSRNLEHARSSRELIDRLSADLRSAQVMVLYRQFDDRTAPRVAGESGNYLVLHQINATGGIVRTIGYYVTAAGGAWSLYRHDSNTPGAPAAGTLPAASAAGAHRVVTSKVQLPDLGQTDRFLFRCTMDRGVMLRGEFGGIDGSHQNRSEYIQCALTTRS